MWFFLYRSVSQRQYVCFVQWLVPQFTAATFQAAQELKIPALYVRCFALLYDVRTVTPAIIDTLAQSFLAELDLIQLLEVHVRSHISISLSVTHTHTRILSLNSLMIVLDAGSARDSVRRHSRCYVVFTSETGTLHG